MTIQTTFEDICANRHGGNSCSADANKRAPKERDRQWVLELIAISSEGLTLKEACRIMGKTPNALSGRISELKRDGLVYVSGRRDGCGVNYLYLGVDVCV
ncbi:MAG: hypothetical protein H8E10_09240 [Desulfobacterales bacterium]|nr:hypothetical protein [Desulfobacterales bacterium]